jgi:predicted SAM-dependent methyltransferase
MDIDPNVKVDYRSLDGIKERFDSVWMLNLVEHLTIPQLIKYLKSIHKILKPGGKLIVWTHNVYALPDLTHYDFSHVQHYPVGDLCGIIDNNSYDIERVYRVLDNRGMRKLRNPFKRLVCGILGVDYCWGLLVVAKKE